MKNIKEFEKELIKLKFKKIFFEDNSGYWFERYFKYRDLRMRLLCEPDNKYLILEVFVYSYIYINGRHDNGDYYPVKKCKCDINTINKIIKKYK